MRRVSRFFAPLRMTTNQKENCSERHKAMLKVDLPIDIDIIGGDRGSGEAYTANVSTELLTPNAGEVSQAINENIAQKREELSSSLFQSGSEDEALSIYEQITNSATESALFSNPTDYSGMRMANDGSTISLWVIILLFAVCAVGGFILARILMQRKNMEEDSVY